VFVLTVSLAGLTGCIADDPDAAPPTSTTSVSTTGEQIPPSSNDGPRFGGFGSSRMGFFSDCPQLLGYLREHTLERVTEWGLGYGYYPYARGDMAATAETTAAASDSAGGMESAPAATGPIYSETNTQEVGVDEGDIVETNGTHLFVAGQDGVRIVDVAASNVAATLAVPQGNHQLILDATRLMVATQPWNSGQEIVVSLFDVADPVAPVLLERQHLEGSLVAARASGGTARLVLTSQLATRLPFVNPGMFGYTTERALAENKRIVETTPIDDWMPRTFREGADGSYSAVATALDCSAVAAPSEFAGLGITWVASIDLAGGGDSTSRASTVRASAGVVSQGGTVYQSASNLYLATVPWDIWYPMASDSPSPSSPPPTYIHQFALGADGSVQYVASGEVTGQLLNQFAMSELGGDLRVATTVNDWSGNGASESYVKVLRPDGDTLVEIGSVGGLGKGEQIYAVRFLGTQAYVVTFKQVDPLYVVDLADPSAPRLVGELKIPGYSAYLHPVGDGLLLGVGQSATLEGVTQGTQLSLFDVRDPANPAQLSTLLLGGSSEAEWDHHAFLYWPETDPATGETVGTIVIPSSPMWGPCPADVRCLGTDITSPAGGVIVAELRGTTLSARGVIQHTLAAGAGPCWNPLQRAVVIDSELATIGFDQVQFSDRATLAVRDTVRWGTPEQYGCYFYAA
jgi:hypothetical protein